MQVQQLQEISEALRQLDQSHNDLLSEFDCLPSLSGRFGLPKPFFVRRIIG